MTAQDVSDSEPTAHGKHDREARARALIEAATDVFAEAGYDAATTRAVAERAGCAEGLIHRYFGGKRGLLIAALDGKCAAQVDMFHDGVPDRETLESEIAELLLWLLQMAQRGAMFMRVSVSQAAIDPEIGANVVARLAAEHRRLLRDKLERHRDAGRIRADADLDAAAETVGALAFHLSFMEQIVMGIAPEQVREHARGAATIVARGLAPAAAGPDSA